MLQFGFQVGRKATHRFIACDDSLSKMYLRVDCEIELFHRKCRATCQMSLLSHQWDTYKQFKNEQSWIALKYMFESIIVDAVNKKDYIHHVQELRKR